MLPTSLPEGRVRSSLNNRLLLLMVLCSGVSLLFSTVAFVSNDLRLLRAAKVTEVTAVAQLIATQCSRAMALGEKAEASTELIVDSLRTLDEVRSAALVDVSGQLRGGFDRIHFRDRPPSRRELGHRFISGGMLDVTVPVGSIRQPLGRLTLRVAVDDLHGQLSNHTAIAGAVLIASLLLSTLFSSQLRSIISKPILNLAELVQRVSTEGDYTLRFEKQTDDEIGVLCDQFNFLLDRIQHSEAQLNKTHSRLLDAHNQLEQRVARRTEQLSEANQQLQEEMEARDRTHRELKASEKRIRAIIDSAADGVVTFDAEGRIESFSPAASRIFGCEESAAIQQSLNIVLPSLDIQALVSSLRKTASGADHGDAEEHLPAHVLPDVAGRTREGTTVPIELSVNRLEFDGRELFTAFARDLSERRLAEQKLAEAHQQLLDASRQAGMAEVANGVLHNVGNVLNSVNVAASIITETVNNSEVGDLMRVLELIEENAADLSDFLHTDPRGGPLVQYLVQARQVLFQERKTLAEKTQSLTTKVDHIKTIVATQQSYAGMSGVEQPVVLQDLMDDALHMNSDSLDRYQIEIEREYEPLPEATVDKQKILQILINLVANAKHAVRDSGNEGGKIRMRVCRESSDFIQLIVEDDGIGIPAENLERIFRHGFTTKRDGHGFGLHSAVLAAREMGGCLTAESDGPGQGARFTLRVRG